MATLTKTAVVTRKAIRYGIYAIIGIIVLRYAIIGFGKLYVKIFPPKPPEPTVAFDKLPKLAIPNKVLEEQPTLVYKLETIDGQLPQTPDQVSVYFMPKSRANLSSLENAQAKARSLGFSSQGTELVESVYEFRNISLPQVFTLNIINNVFSISYDMNQDPSVIGQIPTVPESAISKALGVLGSIGLLPEDLSAQSASHQFIKAQSGKLQEVSSLSEADFVKVNLFRDIIDEIPSISTDPLQANVWFLVGEDKILAGEHYYYPIDLETSSTYPLISTQKAWEKLISGDAIVTSLGDNTDKVTIREVYLAYFDPGQYVEFYQPVIVFKGDNDFFAIVPAITDEFYTTEE